MSNGTRNSEGEVASGGLSLWAYYALVTVALLLPLGAFVGYALSQLDASYRETVDRRLTETARSLALAVNAELGRRVAVLELFAASPAFGYREGSRDLPALYAEAQRVAQVLGTHVVIYGPDSEQLLDTRRPLGAPLPKTTGTGRALRINAPYVSLVVAGSSGRHVVAVNVPVRGPWHEARLNIAAPFDPAPIARMLAAAEMDVGAVATVIDRDNRVVARSRDHGRFIGREVPAWWTEQVGESSAGVRVGPNLDGRPSVLAHASVPIAPGWRVVALLPYSDYRQAWRSPLLAVAAGAFAALALSILLGLLFARRVQVPLAGMARRARDATQALQRGEMPPRREAAGRRSTIREIEALSRSLEVFVAEIGDRDDAQRKMLAELRSALEERDLLLAEVNHRVKNNLQQIEAFLALRGRQVTEPSAREAFDSVRARVHALGLMHRQMLEATEGGLVDAGRIVARLAEDIASLHDAGHALTTRTDRVLVSADIVTPLGLLANELITNAFAHAQPDDGNLRVNVCLELGADEMVMVVGDNGARPLSPEAAARANTVGLRTARGLTQQLGGVLEVTGGDALGTLFRVQIPTGEALHG